MVVSGCDWIKKYGKYHSVPYVYCNYLPMKYADFKAAFGMAIETGEIEQASVSRDIVVSFVMNDRVHFSDQLASLFESDSDIKEYRIKMYDSFSLKWLSM